MAEQIGDERIYLRISELKKGNIQFTDANQRITAVQGTRERHPLQRPVEKMARLERNTLGNGRKGRDP
jgi:hypothetical protein